MRVGLVWAEASGGAIGRGGTMPWHLPEDLAHFKRVTMGDPVVMGRRTWESLPERFRPLPGRENIVITRDSSYRAAGASVVSALDAALVAAAGVAVEPADAGESSVWVIGGGEVFGIAMPLADELIVTRIDLDVPDADTFAPEIGPEWRLADPGETLRSKTGLGYRIERWVRDSDTLYR